MKTDAEGNALKPVSGSVASRPDTKPEVKNPVTVNPKPTTEPVSQAVKSVAKPSVNRIGRRHRVDDDMARSTTAEAYAAENRKKREEARKEQANEERETNKAPKQNQANASRPRRSKKFSEGLKREIPRQELLKILQFGRRHGRNLDSIEDAFEYFNDMGENGYLADRVSTGANNLEAREDMLNRALQGKFYNVPNWREEMGGSDLDFDLETYFNDLENPKHKPKRPERLSDSEPGQVNEGTLNQDDMVNAQADQFEKDQSVRDQYRGEHKDVYADLRRNDSIDRIEKAIQQARIPTDMTKEERDAFYVEDYIPFCQWLDIDPYESFEFITRTISRYYGLAPDRNGQYFKQDEDVTGLTRGDFQRAFANIMENVNGGNHPFAYTRPNMRFHGTRVFPIPHSLTRKEAEVWANKMNGYTASEGEQLGRDIWLKDVQPRINYGDPWCTPAQREAIYDLSDAFEELTWESFRTENQGECPFRFSGRIWGTSSRVSDWFNSGSAEAVKDEGEQVDPHIRDRSAEVQRNMAASFEYQNKKTRPNGRGNRSRQRGCADRLPCQEGYVRVYLLRLLHVHSLKPRYRHGLSGYSCLRSHLDVSVPCRLRIQGTSGGDPYAEDDVLRPSHEECFRQRDRACPDRYGKRHELHRGERKARRPFPPSEDRAVRKRQGQADSCHGQVDEWRGHVPPVVRQVHRRRELARRLP